MAAVKGDGLFVIRPLARGEYMYDYEDELLTAAQILARCPGADCRSAASGMPISNHVCDLTSGDALARAVAPDARSYRL